MNAVIASLAKALTQLGDRAVLRVALKSVLVTLLVFVALGVGLFFAAEWAFTAIGLSGGGFASAAAAVLIAALAAWFLFRVVALAVLQFFADEIVTAVEARHYPALAALARPVPLRREIADALRGLARTLAINALALPVALILWFTGVGPALVFLVVNSWLLGRELTDMVWARHRGAPSQANPVPRSERFVLGGAIATLMLVPFANLLAPILGAAAGTHLTHRTLGANTNVSRENEGIARDA